MINIAETDRLTVRQTMDIAFTRLVRAHAEAYCLAAAIISIAAIAIIH